jgi:hypothetical protein
MFTFLGDNGWRYNVSGRPVFDPFTGLFFYIGLVVCLWRAFRRGAGATQRPSYAILILWLGAMLTPNAVLEANPSFLRAAGGIVPTYLIVAIGLDYVYTWIVQKWPNLKRRWLPSVVVIGLSLTLADSWHSYFNIWKNNPTVRWVYQADLAMIGRYLNEHPPHADTRIFIGDIYVVDLAPQTFIYYSHHHTDWFDPTNSFVWSDTTGTTETWYFVPASIALPSEALRQLSSSKQISRITYPDGELAFTLYHVAPGQINWSPQYSTDLDFVNGPNLIGYDISNTFYRGDTSTMTLHWQIPANQQRLPNQLTWAQVQLEDERGHTWGKYDSLMGYPQASWSSHDRFIQILNLKIPSGMPPGPAYLHFDLHDDDGQSYTIVENWPNQAGPFAVRSHPQASFELKPNALVFDNTLALQDYAFSGLLVPGLPINISLDWAVSSPPTVDYRLQLQLILPGEPEPYLTQTFELWPGVYPPSQWQAGEQVTTFHRLETPLDIPTDTDPELRIQLLNPVTALPLPVTQGSNKLADMTLQLRDHLFEHPPISHPLYAQFGSSIQLLGYDIDTSNSRPNGDIRLTLYWQAKDTPPDAYTVFNHVVDENGQLRWQFDSPPAGDAWLTSTWLPGEIVIDQRVIPIGSDAASGRYALIIGLYTYSDGQRLPVHVDGHPQANDQLILTEIGIGP